MGLPIILEAVTVVPGFRFRRLEVTTLHQAAGSGPDAHEFADHSP